jgi:putative ABC transport system permease protein
MNQSTTLDDIALINPGIGNFGPSFDDNMKYEGRNYRWASVDGVSTNYDRIVNLGIREGRWLTEADNLQRRNVLVIGVSAREALFPNPDEPATGKVVRMNGDTWEIVGVVEKRKSGFFGENEEDQKVFMPYRTSRKAAPLRDFTLFIVQGKPDKLSDTVSEIETILRQRREVPYGEKNNFDIKTPEAFIAQFDGIIGGVGAAAIAISMLGLLVGGIGDQNIMLVSVSE